MAATSVCIKVSSLISRSAVREAHQKHKEIFLANTYVLGRRITPGDAFMKALTKENVDAHFTGVASVTEDGVVGDDGIERKCDTIICATGFDTTWRPQFPIIGKKGVNLQDKWANETNGYLGLAAPGKCTDTATLSRSFLTH